MNAGSAIAQMRTPLVLVVEDEASMADYTRTLLELKPYSVETVASGEEAIERLERGSVPDLVLLDMLMPGIDGLETLERLRKNHPALKVIMISCVTDVPKVVRAISLGAYDYLTKPFKKADLDAVVERCLGSQETLEATAEPCSVDVIEVSNKVSFIAASPAMQRIRSQAALVADYEIPVLLLGESGTGKEVLAMLIHNLSRRSKCPFLKVNCAAMPSELLESELFGYEAGAFTGATKMKPGKFELCEGGTMLLDEIGEMAASLQAKLLHVLQDRQFWRLGGRSAIKANVRVLAATNIDIREAIASKRFRDDLYYRLNGLTLQLPALRERKQEMPLLLKHFMVRQAESVGRPPLPINEELLQACLAYPWPGNIRELENFVKRYLIFGSPELAIAELQTQTIPSENHVERPPSGLKLLARSVKGEAEARAIAAVLEETNWHRGKAAAALKISYKALLYKIRQYGLTEPK